MKAETVAEVWMEYRTRVDGPTASWDELSAAAQAAFADVCRMCEQHGIERAKALASATCLHECRSCGGEGYDEDSESDDEDCRQCNGSGDAVDKVPINWSALDAEIAKENEGG